MKKCTLCLCEKENNFFYKNNNSKDGLDSRCIECYKKRRRERNKSKKKYAVHGLSFSKEYISWQRMMQRCNNKKNSRFNSYGGRGIMVCKEWISFLQFYKDMGKAPEGTSLDRINNEGCYSKENCRWATNSEQMNNTRSNVFLEYNNKKQTIAQWAKELKLRDGTLRTRIRRNWTIERAFK